MSRSSKMRTATSANKQKDLAAISEEQEHGDNADFAVEALLPRDRKRKHNSYQHHADDPPWSLCGSDHANAKALVLMAFLTFVLIRMSHATQPQQHPNVAATPTTTNPMLRAAAQAPLMTYPPPGYGKAELPPGYYYYPGNDPAAVSQSHVMPASIQMAMSDGVSASNTDMGAVSSTSSTSDTNGAAKDVSSSATSTVGITVDGNASTTATSNQVTTPATTTDKLSGVFSSQQQGGQRPTDADMQAIANAIPLIELSQFKDSWDPYESTDTAVFWHIPKAGGSTVKDVLGSCHRHVLATEYGVTDGHIDDTTIAVVYPKGGEVGKDRSHFVNVDTTTVQGIQRAKQMGFADSGLADLVVTPFLYEANDLFTPTAKGRLFSVFRHPIDRAVSMFYYLQVATWEPTYKPELQQWTLEQYATSDIVENNWMCRQLANAPTGDLTEKHLRVAMEVIRRKFLVGLMTDIEASMERFEKFFRWKYRVNPTNQEKCRESLVHGGSNKNSKNKREQPKPGSNEWELLAHQNNYDLQLYEYIENLFKEQEAFVTALPDGYRLVDSTCCKCDPPTYPPEGFTCPKSVLN